MMVLPARARPRSWLLLIYEALFWRGPLNPSGEKERAMCLDTISKLLAGVLEASAWVYFSSAVKNSIARTGIRFVFLYKTRAEKNKLLSYVCIMGISDRKLLYRREIVNIHDAISDFCWNVNLIYIEHIYPRDLLYIFCIMITWLAYRYWHSVCAYKYVNNITIRIGKYLVLFTSTFDYINLLELRV